MDRATKFRYANQLAGAFVLAALFLLLAGIFGVGKARGWFERKTVLHAKFDTEEGSFGLQEGNEVHVKNALAGQVGKVVPNAQGQMEATFIVSRQFQHFIAKDSVAKVKRKFGVAGDTFVEIQAGTGPEVRDGDYLVCKKDEELMDTAQKTLKQVQDIVIPTLEEVRQVVHNANLISMGLAGGEGIAGAVLKDKEITEKVKTMMDASTELVVDSQRAVLETTKILKAAQKHWLLRKYVEPEPQEHIFGAKGLSGRDLAEAKKKWRSDLRESRAANDPVAVSRSACGLAMCLVTDRKSDDEVEALIEEARAESLVAKKGLGETYLVEAEWLRAKGEADAGLHAAESGQPLIGKDEKETRIRAQILIAELLCERDKTAQARISLAKADKMVDSDTPPVVRALAEGAWAQILMKDGQPGVAAKRNDERAGFLQTAGLYVQMASALQAAGDAYIQARNTPLAADRYFRAGRSLLAEGLVAEGTGSLNKALPLARESGDEYLEREITYLIRGTQSMGGTNQPPAATDKQVSDLKPVLSGDFS